jgi:TolB-like protein
VLQGTLRTNRDKIRLTAELVDGPTGTVLKFILKAKGAAVVVVA